MRKVTLTDREWEHLKVILDGDAARRLKTIRDMGNSNYYSDDVVRQGIEDYQKTMELLRLYDEPKQEEPEHAPVDPNDMFRI